MRLAPLVSTALADNIFVFGRVVMVLTEDGVLRTKGANRSERGGRLAPDVSTARVDHVFVFGGVVVLLT